MKSNIITSINPNTGNVETLRIQSVKTYNEDIKAAYAIYCEQCKTKNLKPEHPNKNFQTINHNTGYVTVDNHGKWAHYRRLKKELLNMR